MEQTTKAPRRTPVPRGIARGGPAILSYGFRPFFLGAGIWAVAAMSLWIGALTLGWAPGGSYGALAWHGHEMLFGYTSAAFAGFMLTAIPNWTGRLPVSGAPLLVLVVVWLAGRMVMLAPDTLGLLPSVLVDLAFLPLLGLIAAREIGAGRNWKNLHVVAGVTLLTVANAWYHHAVLSAGDNAMAYRLGISAWMLLISLIGGRLAVSFTRNWLARAGEVRMPASLGLYDRIAMALLVVALALWVARPEGNVTGIATALAALAHGGRVARWRGWRTVAEPLIWILHVAYVFLPLGMAALAASAFGLIGQIAALHLLTIGGIGGMTLAVMTRVTRGHTGRPLTAGKATAALYFCVIVAAVLRPLVEWLPDFYMPVLAASGALWVIAYLLFLAVHAGMLVTPRINAKSAPPSK